MVSGDYLMMAVPPTLTLLCVALSSFSLKTSLRGKKYKASLRCYLHQRDPKAGHGSQLA
jgi:hypothetical protein